MSEQINQAKEQLEKLKEVEAKLKEVEEKAKSTIQSIQENIDESAKGMATRNAEHQKRKQEFEEECQKKIAKLESKNLEENANFAKEMASLKEQLKEKIDWKQVDLVMGKKLVIPIANSKGNCWNTQNSISISADGLKATNNAPKWQSVSAEKGFNISADFPGSVLFYFEVINMSSDQNIFVGISNGNIPEGSTAGSLANSYAIQGGYDHRCWLSGVLCDFEWPNGVLKPKWNGQGDVIGCGLIQKPEDEELWSIFFTVNGISMKKPMQIYSTEDTLYPTVSMYGGYLNASVEANFGDDSAKPFKYDIGNCPGMVFE